MRIRAFLVTVLLILSAAACSSEAPIAEISEGQKLVGAFQSEGVSETAGALAESAENGEPLTLFFTGNGKVQNQPLYFAAQEFMKTYAGAEIVITYVDLSLPSSDNLYNIVEKLKKLNNGNGADIIDGYLDMEELKPNILLSDLNEMMERDLNFSRGDYFEGILDAVSDDGRMYKVPLSISFRFFSMYRKYESLMEEPFVQNGTVNFKQMLDIYDTAARGRGGDVVYLLNSPAVTIVADWIYDTNAMYAEGVPFPSGTGDSRELLRRMLATPDVDFATLIKASESASGSAINSLFVLRPNTQGSSAGLLLDYAESDLTKSAVFAGLNGKVSARCNNLLAINEKCENKELAWGFIKFCMDSRPVQGEDGEPYYIFFQSINKDSFRESVAADVSRGYDSSVESGLVPQKGKADSVAEASGFLLGLAEQCDQLDFSDSLTSYHRSVADYRAGNITFEYIADHIEDEIREFMGVK